MKSNRIFVCWTMDCEATQRAVNDPQLARDATRGFVELATHSGLKVTLYTLPSDAVACAPMLRGMARDDIEIALHYHPQEHGKEDFCGAYSAEEQCAMYEHAISLFGNALGFKPRSFRTGSFSANDATFRVTADLGFGSCSHSCPGRKMIHLRSNWVQAPAYVHYAHPSNRLLEEGLDLVEVPLTTDPDSMLWSGGHPQDLRVELFDAKNQRFLIDKMIAREKSRDHPVPAIVVLTHNVFRYHDASDFRHQTMRQMILDFTELAGRHGVELVPSTISEIADAYRRAREPITAPAEASGNGEAAGSLSKGPHSRKAGVSE